MGFIGGVVLFGVVLTTPGSRDVDNTLGSLLPELVPLEVVSRRYFLRPPKGYEPRAAFSCRVLQRLGEFLSRRLPLCFLKLKPHDGDNLTYYWELLFPHLYMGVWIESALQIVG